MAQPENSPCTAIRRFNRFYTEAIGVLEDEHLGTGLTLGQARILFEIGQLGCVDIHTLRMHLGLDSGYLSRALAVLVDEKLVRTKLLSRDRRVKLAMLTHRPTACDQQVYYITRWTWYYPYICSGIQQTWHASMSTRTGR